MSRSRTAFEARAPGTCVAVAMGVLFAALSCSACAIRPNVSSGATVDATANGAEPRGALAASSQAAQDAYTPVFARTEAKTQAQRGSLQGDFAWAATSPSVGEARSRWTEFLREHEPASGEYEDGAHKLHVDAARYELMRVHYLLGARADGDRIMRTLDPLQVETSSR